MRRSARWRGWTLAVLTAGVGVGCAFADPGTGTGALSIQGGLTCDFSALATQVHLTIGGGPDDAPALVVLTDADTQRTLSLTANPNHPSDFLGTWPGYHRRVYVHVTAGAESLAVALEGPSPHTLTAPPMGVTLPAGSALKVAWAAPDGVRAEAVTVRLTGVSDVTHAKAYDGGTDTFARAELLPGRQAVSVTRSMQVQPAGARHGSLIGHSYTVTAPLIISEP